MPHLPDHQTEHDPRLIAAYAAGDAEGADLERAQALVAACDDCAALHHDLRAIAAALPALPAPTRPRDFRLTPEQAASLRQTGWRRLLAPLAGPRFAFAAPLGGSLAALGLAGILIAGAASTPIAGTGGARDGAGVAVTASGSASGDMHLEAPSAAPAEAPAPSDETRAAGVGLLAGGEASASSTPVDRAPAPQATSVTPEFDAAGAVAGTKNAPVARATDEQGTADTPAAVTSPAVAAVAPLAGIALAAGLLLLVARVVARRVA